MRMKDAALRPDPVSRVFFALDSDMVEGSAIQLRVCTYERSARARHLLSGAKIKPLQASK